MRIKDKRQRFRVLRRFTIKPERYRESDESKAYCVRQHLKPVTFYFMSNDRLYRITTYEQICSSYPKLKIPVTIESPEDQEAWREEEFNRRAGPFHKVEWHRIVLDGMYMAFL